MKNAFKYVKIMLPLFRAVVKYNETVKFSHLIYKINNVPFLITSARLKAKIPPHSCSA